MAQRNVKVDFDEENDIISLFREGMKSKFSFDIELPKGDIVVDFGFNGEIVGLEMFNASEYFPELKKMKKGEIKAEMSVQYGRNWAQIFYALNIPGVRKKIERSLISPYNKKIILEH